MKIKDIIKEGWVGSLGRELAKAATQQWAPNSYAATARSMGWDKPNDPESMDDDDPRVQAQLAKMAGSGPEEDISKLVDPGQQFKFQNPDNPGSFIIIRQDGYFVDRIPRALAGSVRKDPKSGLYPVLRPDNIKKYNEYYNRAADAGRVIEEPIVAL